MNNMDKKRIKMNFSYIIVAIYILFVLIMVISKGDNIYIPVHDYLDSHITHYKVLHDSHQFFSGSDTVVDYMGGIDRDFLPSELKMYCLPFVFLEPISAMVLIYIARIILSVLGGVHLGNCVLKEKAVIYKNIVIICSFIYGILPSAPVWNLCFAIYPFMFAQIYRIYKREAKLKDALILFLFAFFSELAHFGVFICSYLIVFIIFDWLIHKRLNKLLITAIVALGSGYLVSEYRMFRVILFKQASTIRSEFTGSSSNLVDAINMIKDGFIESQYHCATAHKYIVLPLCILYLGYLIYQYSKKRKLSSLIKNPFIIGIVWISLNTFLYGIESWSTFYTLIKNIPLIGGISFANVIRLNSFLWYFELTYILIKIYKANLKKLSYVICFLAVLAVFKYDTVYNTIKFNWDKVTLEANGDTDNKLSYREFYSENLFNKIKKDIKYEKEWSVAYGMHPAVLSYNQIATLDGYHSWYTLNYKYKFREIIAPELNINERWSAYFDGWGGRAYIFSEKVTYDPIRYLGVDKDDLNTDMEAFKALNGKYIFSRVEISNAENLSLQLKGIYTDESSPYVIYVYSCK